VKIPPVEADFFHADTERDGHRLPKLIYAFYNLRKHLKFIKPQNKQRFFFPDRVINNFFLITGTDDVNNQQDATTFSFINFLIQPYMFRVTNSPILRSIFDCI